MLRVAGGNGGAGKSVRGGLGNGRQAGNGMGSQAEMEKRALSSTENQAKDGKPALWQPSLHSRDVSTRCSWQAGCRSRSRGCVVGTLQRGMAPPLQWEAGGKDCRGQPGRI